jgi:hypothetical protein
MRIVRNGDPRSDQLAAAVGIAALAGAGRGRRGPKGSLSSQLNWERDETTLEKPSLALVQLVLRRICKGSSR